MTDQATPSAPKQIKTKRYPRGPRVKIIVDTDLIEISKERDSSHCMIAEAIRDVLPHVKSISVDLQTIRFSDPAKGLRYTYLTPRIAQLALINFDQGITPESFEFTLAGSQVTAMSFRVSSGIAPRPSEARNAALKKGRAVLRQTIASPERGTNIQRRVGGKAPPTTGFAKRRTFGLRALVR
jgi:hypothetical protein